VTCDDRDHEFRRLKRLGLITGPHILEVNIGRLRHFGLKALQVTEKLLRQLLGLRRTPIANNQNSTWIKAV